MRKISEILRLHDAGLSGRQIATSLRISRTAVSNTLKRAKAAQIAWPLPEDLDERALHERLYPAPLPSLGERPLPDWDRVHKEMRRKGVTLMLLWEEYQAIHPSGYRYSRFCELYRTWRRKLDVTMRQHHKAGEKLFVDYAGQTMEVIDPETGQARTAQIFVATLGASNYTYVADLTSAKGHVDAVARRLDRLAPPGFRVLRRGARSRHSRQPEDRRYEGPSL